MNNSYVRVKKWVSWKRSPLVMQVRIFTFYMFLLTKRERGERTIINSYNVQILLYTTYCIPIMCYNAAVQPSYNTRAL